ncbi:MAG: tetratricopeptide repeat protein [Desulfuromonadaceae bacterium]|nr:tetratricopeptide repeat protein [Desulfuromonadaceae bacterium]MDD5104158.1 tetratricopeptide repeat protein [Desulfuromonadaceae bacterium]
MDNEFSEAIQFYHNGQLSAAESVCRRIIARNPSDAEAMHLLGLLAYQQGQFQDALELIGRAIDLSPAVPGPYLCLGEIFRSIGRPEQAEAVLCQALKVNPDFSEAFVNLSNLLNEQGRCVEAENICRKALEINPDNIEVLCNLGNSLHDQGKFQDAETAYRVALTRNPEYASTYNNLAVTLNSAGRYGEALLACEQALARSHNSAEACVNKGIALKGLGRFQEAEHAYRQSLEIRPDQASTYSSLGTVLSGLGRHDEAIAAYQQALILKPNLHECRLKLTMMMATLQNETRSLSTPDAKFEQALDELEQVMSQETWPSLGAAIGVAQPFAIAYHPGDHTASLSHYGSIACHARSLWFASRSFPVPVVSHTRERLRLLIVSGQISNHSVWNVILHGLLKHLDRTRFEVILYNTTPHHTSEADLAKKMVDCYRHGRADWLQLLLADQPDAIFYPEIAMDPVTVQLATLRLAPLQIAGWGHPITTGLPTMDLFVSGELLERSNAEVDYCEQLVRLPGTGACSVLPLIEPSPPDPIFLDLPLDLDLTRFFICQQAAKFAPEFDDIYPRIARASSPCRFWFVCDAKASDVAVLQNRICHSFVSWGLDPAIYVRFIDWMPGEQFLGTLDVMDIFLDTPAFSGYTTAWQALHRGLPIVTLEGRYMRQRLAAGLLRRIGITGTIATDEHDYVHKAAALTRNRELRIKLRTCQLQNAQRADEDINVVRAFESAISNFQ